MSRVARATLVYGVCIPYKLVDPAYMSLYGLRVCTDTNVQDVLVTWQDGSRDKPYYVIEPPPEVYRRATEYEPIQIDPATLVVRASTTENIANALKALEFENLIPNIGWYMVADYY